jgi:hypothetical protein
MSHVTSARMKRTHSLLSAAGGLMLVALPGAQAELSFLSGVSLPGGGEVVSHYNNTSGADLVLTTNSSGTNHAVNIYSLGTNGVLGASPSAMVNLASFFGGGADTLSISSVSADPNGRGFGVATIIPTANNTTLGKIAFFDVSTGNVLGSVDVGYHPDAVRFTPDGSKIVVANEGEYVASGPQSAGSVSIVNLSGITSASDFTSITPTVTDVNFSTGLASGVNLDNIRINTTGVASVDRHLYVEPEYIAATNSKLYVTLQENNAIATIDLDGGNANKVTSINSLGTITLTIDASDRDPENGGIGAVNINDTVKGLPMPDTTVTFEKNGVRLIATANEGDARLDDGDLTRAGAAGIVDTVDSGGGDAIFSGSLNNTSGIGRLNISKVDGDIDGDGLIEVPTMFGTRSVSVWGEDGSLVFDSGSMIETYVRDNAIKTFNMNNGNSTAIDTRSDDKGPEPEALAFGSIDGRDYLFVGAERQNGIFQIDITDFNAAYVAGYFNVITGEPGFTTSLIYVSPETIQFVSAADSPTGKNLLLVGYEGVAGSIDGSIAVLEVTAVPEPAEVSIGIGAALLGLILMRRFRRPRIAS